MSREHWRYAPINLEAGLVQDIRDFFDKPSDIGIPNKEGEIFEGDPIDVARRTLIFSLIALRFAAKRQRELQGEHEEWDHEE